ncbi:hypothetical protein ACHHYP_16755 [Achlya hypogyna]|uniref:Uncharacterized protein n=1 Tax=Achlya hypogyna TaxID=1202772 RepID=A0A1V9Y5W4_ACHHY|nr:hypothetical protein ACHHYP_16755 [Achlya hypogyna]
MATVTRVPDGEHIVGVAETSTLSRSTISKYLNMIDMEIEKDTVAWVAGMQRSGMPTKREAIIAKANQVLAKLPQPHPDQLVSAQCNKVDKDAIDLFFNQLLCAVVTNKSKSRKVVAVRGSPNVWKEESKTAYHLTIIAAVAATGKAMPPAFLLPGVSVDRTILDKCPMKCAFGTSAPKGFVNGTAYDD